MSDSNQPKSNEKPAQPTPSPGESVGGQRDIQTSAEKTSTSELRDMLDNMRAMVLAQLKESKDPYILAMINQYTDGAYAREYSEKHVEKPLALAEMDRTPATNATATQTPTSSEPRVPFWDAHRKEMNGLGWLMDRLFDLQVSQLTPAGEIKTLPEPHTPATKTDAPVAFSTANADQHNSTKADDHLEGAPEPAQTSPPPKTNVDNTMPETRQPTANTTPEHPMRAILNKLLEAANQIPIPEEYKGRLALETTIRKLGIVAKDPAQVTLIVPNDTAQSIPAHQAQNMVERTIALASWDFEDATSKRLDLSTEQHAARYWAIGRDLTELDAAPGPFFPSNQSKPSDKPAAPDPATLGPTEKTQMENTMSESNQPAANNKSAISAPTADDPMRQILTKLMENANQIPEQYKELGIIIRDLGIAGKDPTQFGQNTFQLKIASALGDFEYVTKSQLDLSAKQRAAAQVAQTRRLTEPATGPNASSAPENGGGAKPAPETPPPADPIRDVLTKLMANISQLPDSAEDLRKTIQALDEAAQEPVRFNQRSVQHKVAYATQDFEKATGNSLDLAPAQRVEVTKLAASAPGLGNERMLELLRSTPKIGDSRLVRDIRRDAFEIGKLADQSTPETQSLIENLENKVRQAARATEPANDARAGDVSPKAEQAGSPGNNAANGNRNDQQRPPNAPDQRGAHSAPNTQQVPGMQTAVLRGGILDTLTAVLRGNGQPNNAPWDPAPTPLGTRLQAFEAKVAARQQDEGIERVQNWARAAANAMDGFRNTEGATIMNRIQTAARAEPGGMATVLSEMRQGGKFGDLREAFDKALIDDKGFGAAYDKAATALARYGSGREKVEQIIAKRPDAANLAAKFEQLDGEIGEKASSIPSRNQGKNMLDDISTTIAEILQRAADKVRAIFRPGPTVSPSASPAA